MLDKLPEGVKTLKKIRDTLNDELQGMNVFGQYPERLVNEVRAAIEIIEETMTERAGTEWETFDPKNVWYAWNNKTIRGKRVGEME